MLLQKGVELVERDFFQDRFSEDELRSLIDDTALTELFSWNSPSYKKLGLEREDLDDDHLISMMLEEPRLIRRPLTFVEGTLIIGSDENALGRAFP